MIFQQIQRYTSAFFLIVLFSSVSLAQQSVIRGELRTDTDEPLMYANIVLEGTDLGATTDVDGHYEIANLTAGTYTLSASYLGYATHKELVTVTNGQLVTVDVKMTPDPSMMSEVVVTGTLKAVNRLQSPVPVEVYHPKFFVKNPTPNIYEALQNVNGVRPQLNCQVCNTGDIHINGLEGPYTMVLIDGMPIVSSLATVYGLSGIPNSLIERMEIVKGPASSLYGSEAIGGLINIITKNPTNAPVFSADIMATTWKELNADLGIRFRAGEFADVLTGINYFNFDNIVDHNDDNFTDVTLQERVSIFQKWNIRRKSNRLFTLAGRYYHEDRWGGELQWTKAHRGGTDIYGEAITTERVELLGQYQLPVSEHMMASFSYNAHDQNSVYGNTSYIADQKIGFGQLTWDKHLGRHDLLLGTSLRYTYYDDNTPATGGDNQSPENAPDEIWLPGVFIQDEISLHEQHKMLLGMRYDYHDVHGHIVTPRLAYKWSPSPKDIIRINTGTGFRVVNLFAEDHAALTGARDIVIAEELDPERSVNVNLNYTRKIFAQQGTSGTIELSAWYTYFDNVILPDYETNANQIIYDNLDGSAVTKGLSLNSDFSFANGLSVMLGASLLDVSTEEDGKKSRQLLTERFTGTWAISYPLLQHKLSVDYTGNVYGPMLLPVLSDTDPRPTESPWWSIQNIQFTYKGLKNIEFYAGVKNLLDWTPWINQDAPIIARAFDPFDKDVVFDGDGNPVPTPNNPYALTFDPAYVYAPNQGIRGFVGIRYALR